MYKTESVLGLIGSILAAVIAALCLAGSLIMAFLFKAFEPGIQNLLNNMLTVLKLDSNSFMGFMSGAFIICAIVGFVLAAVSFILGFIGTAKLRKGEKSGGVILIIAGVFALISVCGFIPFVLFLVGGIMAVSKKQTAAQ